MRPETIIKLRRGFGGVRATRSEGAYCANCKVGVALGGHARVAPRPASVWARLAFAARGATVAGTHA
jgi:hypothetical protein